MGCLHGRSQPPPGLGDRMGPNRGFARQRGGRGGPARAGRWPPGRVLSTDAFGRSGLLASIAGPEGVDTSAWSAQRRRPPTISVGVQRRHPGVAALCLPRTGAAARQPTHDNGFPGGCQPTSARGCSSASYALAVEPVRPRRECWRFATRRGRRHSGWSGLRPKRAALQRRNPTLAPIGRELVDQTGLSIRAHLGSRKAANERPGPALSGRDARAGSAVARRLGAARGRACAGSGDTRRVANGGPAAWTAKRRGPTPCRRRKVEGCDRQRVATGRQPSKAGLLTGSTTWRR